MREAALKSRRVLITGAGTLAQALLARFLGASLFTRGEYSVARLVWQGPVRASIGDVRNADAVCRAVVDSEAEYVIHTAAMKQVGAGAANAVECASVNVEGTVSVLRSCQQAGVPMLFTSSDKAVEPLNTYGKAKALAEDIVLGAGMAVTRWGNIVRSRGSVLERWERTGQICVTDASWTRYWLTRDEAADFLRELVMADARGLHVRYSKSATMGDLVEAAVRADVAHGTVRTMDVAPGEKAHERLSLDHGTSADVERYTVDELAAIIRTDRERWPL